MDDGEAPPVPVSMPELTLFTQSLDDPAASTAAAAALLRRVADGRIGPAVRVHRVAPTVAFGRADRNAPNYADAVAAAEAAGFATVERLAGGRAAVFHEGTIAFSLVVPTREPRLGIVDRFDAITRPVVAALRALGVEAAVGEVPGEYCPGTHSVHARHAVKLAGFGQRLVTGAAHVGGVIVAEGGDRIRDVLVPVYEALGLAWDPATAGDVAGEAPGAIDVPDVERALLAALGREADLRPAPLPDDLLAEAHARADDHRPTRPGPVG